ncbi:MAG: TerB family tellurite resistance protein [Rhizobiaceae bacterium]|nr:TerB family tellurite resistance protein [Rhizobiaceae bacterium]
MLDRFISFLKQIDAPRAKALDADDPRVAAAALMFHVVNVDGVLDAAEEGRLRDLLSSTYDVEGEALERLLAAGDQADRESIDFYAFTSVLNRHLDETERKKFVGLLWEVVFFDGEMHELEEDTVWRVAELLGVDGRDRVELRRRAKAESEARRARP